MKNLSADLKYPMLDEDLFKAQEAQKSRLTKYLATHMKRHNILFFQFIFCEFLNFLNVILQLWVLNLFLDGQFSTYGVDVWKFYKEKNESAVDPSDRVFPKVTKCFFNKFGTTGMIEKIDGELKSWEI